MVFAFLSNPIVLTIFLAATVGVVIYEIYEQEKRRQPVGRRSRPPSSPPPFSSPGNSDQGSANNIRNRKSDSREAIKDKKVSPKTRSFSDDNNINSDYQTKIYEKSVRARFRNDTEIDKNSEEIACNEDSFFSQNDLNIQSEETKLLNTPGQTYDKESNQNCAPSVFVESDYKKAVLAKIEFDVIKGQLLCKACENEVADSVFEPCGHCYLCSVCAVSLFRIYGKCTICDASVSDFKYVSK